MISTMGNALQNIGNELQSVGYSLLPMSIAAYFIMGIVLYRWKMRYYLKLIKTIWYLLQLILTISKDASIEMIALTILAFEAFDSLLDYCEGKKEYSNDQHK